MNLSFETRSPKFLICVHQNNLKCHSFVEIHFEQMSLEPKSRQDAFRMSDQRYKSNGLADENFSQTASTTSSKNSQQINPTVEKPFVTTKKKCVGNSCPQETPKNIQESSPPPLNTSKPTEVENQSSQQTTQRNSLETSSHIVGEVDHTVNKLLSYEEEALDKIEKITKDIETVYKEMEKVEKFGQMSEYKKFEEFFLQKNIELDNVDPKNNDQVREFRKAAVRYVQDCMYNLDQKQKMSVEL